jgi:hypothetical protein
MQLLCRKFDIITFENGKTIEDYTLRLNGMVAHLTTLSEETKDSEISVKMLHSLPPHLKQIVIVIKTLLRHVNDVCC